MQTPEFGNAFSLIASTAVLYDSWRKLNHDFAPADLNSAIVLVMLLAAARSNVHGKSPRIAGGLLLLGFTNVRAFSF